MAYKPGTNPNSRNGFKKGHTTAPEVLAKISASLKGKVPWNKGKKTSPITLAKLRGRKRSIEARARMSKACKGRRISEQARTKLSAALQGITLEQWVGFVTPPNELARKSTESRLWREDVFKRDNHTCQECGVRGGDLHADHIKPFSLYPDLRFDVDNGRTLCVACHQKTNTYGSKIRTYHV